MAGKALFWNTNNSPQVPLLIHNSKIPSFVPALQSTAPNVSLTLDHAWNLEAGNHLLQDLEFALQDLLWHPCRFLPSIAFSACSLILAAPPLLRFGILYLIFRYTVYRWIVWGVNDYQAYLDLGRGGSPCDIWGWWRVTRLKLMAGLNVLDPPHVPPMLNPYRGILWNVPLRNGPRPIVKGIAPQRQVNQRTPVSTFDALSSMISIFAEANPHELRVETSFLEGHTSALKFNRHDVMGIPNTQGEFGFEICHPHRNDGSLHMIMHPEDIRTVIEAGWAERHPLATSRWYWRLWYHGIRQRRTPVSEYLVLVYAPRNQAELEVVYKLMQASVWFATRKVLDSEVPQLNRFTNGYIPEQRRSSTSSCSKCACYDG